MKTQEKNKESIEKIEIIIASIRALELEIKRIEGNKTFKAKINIETPNSGFFGAKHESHDYVPFGTTEEDRKQLKEKIEEMISQRIKTIKSIATKEII